MSRPSRYDDEFLQESPQWYAPGPPEPSEPDLHVVQVIVLEPINPDRIGDEDPDGPFINNELLEQVDTGIYGPFENETAADHFVAWLQERQKASNLHEKVRYRIIPLSSPPEESEK